MKLKFSVLFFLLGAVLLSAAAAERTTFTLPKMKRSPSIDGNVSASEYRDAVKLFGTVNHNSEFFSVRNAETYFAIDNKALYFVCKSELPPAGMKLLSRVRKKNGMVFLDDNVELSICPPNSKFAYQLIANSRNVTFAQKFPIINGGVTLSDKMPWNHQVKVASKLADGFWTVEIAIPLSDLGEKSPTDGTVYKLLAGRNWKRPSQQTSLHKAMVFCNPDEMIPFKVKNTIPFVKFHGLGKNIRQGSYNIAYEVTNPGKTPSEVSCRVMIVSDSAPRQIDQTVTVQPGKSVPVKLDFFEANQVSRIFEAEFTDLRSGAVIHKRKFCVDPIKKVQWIDPKKVESAELEFGVYPYFKKLKLRFGSPAQSASNWKSAVYTLLRDGKKIAEYTGTKGKYGFENEFAFDPVPGNYTVNADLVSNFDKKIRQSKKFEIKKFPWEHNTIGTDRIIIPPFKKLTYPAEREIKATMTAYRFKDGFFDRISAAECENILAGPIQFVINGIALKEKSFRFVEKSDDRAVTESVLTWKDGTITVKGEFDYDGFCKFTMNVAPTVKAAVKSAVIRVPMRADIATLMHSTCDRMRLNDAGFIPSGKGKVWGSANTEITAKLRGNFRPYLWLGGLEKGLSWLSETDRYWSLDEKKDALSIERDNDQVIFNIHLVNKSTVWEKPFVLQQGFQATPVKPQPAYRRRLQERARFANAWTLCTLAGAACWGMGYPAAFYPVNRDYSFINYLRDRKFEKEADLKFVNDYMARHMSKYTEAQKKTIHRHLLRGIHFAKISKYMIPYTNARISHLAWEEYQTYMDEWWCSEYRAGNADEYNNTTTRSYQDMVLYTLRKMLREGMEGIYYDNIRDWANPNMVTGPAYRRADGTVQPYFDFFDLREMVKRTAIMLYQEKKTFPDGRPILTFHMTNTNLVPIMSWGSISLDLEAQYGSKDFQDRFTEGYLRSCTLGTQTGMIPEILVQISGKQNAFVSRTFLAVTLAYDLPFVMSGGGLTGIWANTWRKLYNFGYSTDEVEVFPTFAAEKSPASTDRAEWRLCAYRKKSSGETVVAVCSFGGSAEGTVKVDGAIRCVDMENGKELPTADGKVKLTVNKHDFALLKFYSK